MRQAEDSQQELSGQTIFQNSNHQNASLNPPQDFNVSDGLEAADSPAPPIDLDEESADVEVVSQTNPEPASQNLEATEVKPVQETPSTSNETPITETEPGPNNGALLQDDSSAEAGPFSEMEEFIELDPFTEPESSSIDLQTADEATISSTDQSVDISEPNAQSSVIETNTFATQPPATGKPEQGNLEHAISEASEQEPSIPDSNILETNNVDPITVTQTNAEPASVQPVVAEPSIVEATQEEVDSTAEPLLQKEFEEPRPQPVDQQSDAEPEPILNSSDSPQPSNFSPNNQDDLSQTATLNVDGQIVPAEVPSQLNEYQLLAIFFLVLILIAVIVWYFRRIQDYFLRLIGRDVPKRKRSSRAPNLGWFAVSNEPVKVEESFAAGAPTNPSGTSPGTTADPIHSAIASPQSANDKVGAEKTPARPRVGHPSFKPPPSKAGLATNVVDSDGFENGASKINELTSLVQLLEDEKLSLSREKIKLAAKLERAVAARVQAESLANKAVHDLETNSAQTSNPAQESQVNKTPHVETSAVSNTKGNVIEAKSELLIRLKDEQQKRETAEQELHLAIGEARSLKQALRDIEKEKTKLENEHVSPTEVESANAEVARLKQKLTEKDDQFSQQETMLTQRNHDLTELTQERDMIKWDLSEAETQLQQAKQELQSKEELESKHAKNAVEHVNSELSELKSQFAKQKEQLTQQEKQLAELTKDRDGLQSDLSLTNSQLQKANAELESKQSALDAEQVNAELTQLRDKISSREKELAQQNLIANDLTKDRDTIKSQLFQTTTQLQKANEELELKQTAIASSKASVNELNEKLKDLKEQKTRVSKEATEFAQTSRELKNRLAELEKNLAQTSKERNVAFEKVVEFENLFDSQTKVLSQSQSTFQETQTELQGLRKQISEKDERLSELQNAVESLESRLQTSSSQLERELADQKQQVSERTAQVDERDKELVQAKARFDQVNAACEALKQTIAGQKAEFDTATAAQKALKTNEEESRQRIKALEADLKNFTERNTEISDLLIEERRLRGEGTQKIEERDAQLRLQIEESNQLREQLTQLDQSSLTQLADRKSAISKLESEVERLHRNQSEQGQSEKEMEDLVRRLKAIASAKGQDLEELQRLSDVNEASYEKLVNKAKKYKSELTKSVDQIKQLHAENADLKRLATEYQQTAQAFKQKADATSNASTISNGNGASKPVPSDEANIVARQLAREHVLLLKTAFEKKVKKKNEQIRQLKSRLRMTDESRFHSES